MSKATDLATKCFVFADSAMGLRIFNEHELDAFYHAARAEALREAADEIHKLFIEEIESQTPRYHDIIDCCATLRQMADMKGK